MIHIGLLGKVFNKQDIKQSKRYELITNFGSNFFSWNGQVYQSDIIRAAISIKATTIGKAVATHIRTNSGDKIQVNPDINLSFLLSEPNPVMTGQMLQEKMITQLELNNNAFAFIQRDDNGQPSAIWPISASSLETLQDGAGSIYIRFYQRNGQVYTFAYANLIHLRKDFNENEILGESNVKALTPLMEVVTTTDQSIINAIKNSSVIRWLLKFNQSLRPEKVKEDTEQFVKTFLNTQGEDGSIGAAGVDSNTEAIQIHPDDFVPNEKQMQATVDRIYSLFHINKEIIQATYTEDQWISWYESQIEPLLRQMSEQWTNKLFSRRERGFNNQIVFESNDLSYASMDTKLNLYKLVDRAIMTPNEMRRILNLAPVDGGDQLLLRKDTGTVEGGETDNDKDHSD